MKIRNLSANRMLAINMVASAITYFITFGISFFLSPYIVRTVGVEAYGFLNLANNFVSYASLSTVALNALSGRFITVRLYERDIEGANTYYTSVFFANVAISLVILFVETIVWFRLESFINIPTALLWDVKLLFGALFINSVLSTVGSVFNVSTFATNKLYLSSLRTIESSLIRAFVLFGAFMFFAPHVWYLGVTSLLTNVYCLLYNLHYTRILTPELRIRRRYFNFKAVKELTFSGVWSLVNRLGQILLDGLDLLITNLFIDAAAMGVLSLAKTVPGVILTIVGNIVGVFSPNFTILFSEKRNAELIVEVKKSMKILGVLVNLPVIILIVCGEGFFQLWQPTQNAHQLQVLSIITIIGICFSGGINSLYNIFTVYNRIKANSLVVIASGFLSFITTFCLVKFTNLGVYAVAGVSTFYNIIRNILFTAPYGAKCMSLKWYAFYPDIIRPVCFVIVSVLICQLVLSGLPDYNWVFLIIKGMITGVLSLSVGLFVILKKTERQLLLNKIKRQRAS